MSQDNELENLEAETQLLLTQIRQPVAARGDAKIKSKSKGKGDDVQWDGSAHPRPSPTVATFAREKGRLHDIADDYLPNPKVASLVQERKRFADQAVLLKGEDTEPAVSKQQEEGETTYAGPSLQLPDLKLGNKLTLRPLSAQSHKSDRSTGPLSGRSWNGFADLEAEFDVEDEFGYNLGAPVTRVNAKAFEIDAGKYLTPRQQAAENVRRSTSATERPSSQPGESKEFTASATLGLGATVPHRNIHSAGSRNVKTSDAESKDASSLLRNDGTSLFLADGTANINLRDTVRNALRVTRFDSVSTIMAHGPNVLKPTRSKTQKVESNYELGPLRHKAKELSLAASFAMGSKRGKKKKTRARSPEAAGMMSGHPGSVRDVSYGGFEADELSNNDDENANLLQSMKKPDNVCFGCWSAAV